jgi:hypothetical protein
MTKQEMSNPNNCKTCGHAGNTGMSDGHCYMFKNVPTKVCMYHTGRKNVGTFGHVGQHSSSDLQGLILAELLKR